MAHKAAPHVLTISTYSSDGWTVVEVTGELDAQTCGQLRAALQEATDAIVADPSAARDTAGVVLDLSRVPFLDSSALGVLVAVGKRLSARDARLQVVSDRSIVRRIFSVTALDTLFPVLPTLDEALHAA